MSAKGFHNLVDLAIHQASTQADLPLYTYLDRGERPTEIVTCAALETRARKVAGCLQALGETGERVLLLLPNRLDFAIAFGGCLFAGMVAVPVPIPRGGRSLARLLGIARAADTQLVLTNSAVAQSLRKLAAENPDISELQLVTLEDLPDLPWRMPKLDEESLAFLQFTSGSTGEAKGVMVSHGNLLHNLQLLELGFDPSPEGCIVSWLPFFHDWGLIGGLLQPLYLGIRCVIFDPLDFLSKPLRWLAAISRFRATISGAPNFAYDLCVQQAAKESPAQLDLTCWETAIVAAEPVRAGTLARFSAQFSFAGFHDTAFYPSYGLAESTLVVTGIRKREGPTLLTLDRKALEQDRILDGITGESIQTHVGCGRPLGDLKVAIVHSETGRRCGDQEVGEIWVSGDSVAKGYWKDPTVTQSTFMAQIDAETGSLFLRTGDLGFMRREQLFVTGRSKDLVGTRWP